MSYMGVDRKMLLLHIIYRAIQAVRLNVCLLQVLLCSAVALCIPSHPWSTN
jgi:hypothetical protein